MSDAAEDWIMRLHEWSISSSDPITITRSTGISSSVLVGVWPLEGITHFCRWCVHSSFLFSKGKHPHRADLAIFVWSLSQSPSYD